MHDRPCCSPPFGINDSTHAITDVFSALVALVPLVAPRNWRSRESRLPEIDDGFDLDERLRPRERSHFHECRSRELAAEELTARTPHFGVVVDVHQEDRQFDEI